MNIKVKFIDEDSVIVAREYTGTCEHINIIEEDDYEEEQTITTCKDCGSILNRTEEIWYV